jgi:hypothetical protein
MNSYQQWTEQRAQRHQPVQIPQSREWMFSFTGTDQSGESVSYSVRMAGNSYGRTFSQACQRFYENFPGGKVVSTTTI